MNMGGSDLVAVPIGHNNGPTVVAEWVHSCQFTPTITVISRNVVSGQQPWQSSWLSVMLIPDAEPHATGVELIRSFSFSHLQQSRNVWGTRDRRADGHERLWGCSQACIILAIASTSAPSC